MERSFANATWASRHLLKEEETGRRELEETDLQINKQSVYLRIIRAFGLPEYQDGIFSGGRAAVSEND